MSDQIKTLSGRREFLFLYDIKMGNPNGDPDENRPRVLPDGTYYVTDVRLKRFSRDFLKSRKYEILVDNIEGRTTNLTGRVVHYLANNGKEKVDGQELVKVLLDAFIDARLFGSSLAFKEEKFKDDKGKDQTWKAKPVPKTLTGAVQLNMGEVLHRAESVDIHGTSVFGSDESKSQGTFTSYYGLRYALIGFSGFANEHSAELSRLSDEDYELLLKSLWHGVRSAGNTRTKVGQIPRLILSIDYQPGEEFQFGRLHDYVKLLATAEKEEKEWSSPDDYQLDLGKLVTRINEQKGRISTVRYAISKDIGLTDPLPEYWEELAIEDLPKGR
ncbi:type I-B CRISPR-associated protein Cas7/Csh2 [Desulfosporosinus sp. BICA1-9]|uniref:type I-B CRISPR-associated protein Cas7/Csh2 n=1 Tax=Desulfosporosinus sp. BICA1-9 TaxID=1531958 RepID=UPI00054B130B|nr:type I-B CRISPR-associated protein Cas7/Csh2 [Desulfosporosinus sp. BICA1-9]KJS49403.1 MAG: CRISPR-associated protein Csh2 [Peptococcaceae bacterium BRH_c23]KJS87127.1 MAG: CRISPR-associated protein Csh2 [Desulfosporosinus sp. BICA1-9]HBW37349.1 type I-B CRISPR-associated protein Cas7/Csh2 [Desulfosporosinus sp.]